MMNLLGAATALFPIQMTGKSSVFARVVKVISDNPDEFLTALGQHVFNLVLIPVLLAIVIAFRSASSQRVTPCWKRFF
jgi:hypothetical protein